MRHLNFIMDLIIIMFACIISVWQKNPSYLWLVLLVAGTGGYYDK